MKHSHNISRFCGAGAIALVAAIVLTTGGPLQAEAPGRGLTLRFEVDYLKFIINHHFSALRITELAAGTDLTRDEELGPEEGTSPSPGFPATHAKSAMDDIKSMARRANRTQREEILQAQRFLKEWYGITHEPQLTESGRAAIRFLTSRANGRDFDHKFLEVFSVHHRGAATRSLECLFGRELTHDELQRYCRGIVEAQMLEIDEMRHMLCREFDYCDFQPFSQPDGRHS